MAIVSVVAGIVIVLWGADKFTDGAGSLALRMNIPPIVVGLTVVAFGTSAPELFISLLSALNGTSGMAIGNVVGSNIFNTLLIVGVSAAVAPIAIARGTVRKDIPFGLGASLLFVALCLDGDVSRVDGILLLAAFFLFMVYTLCLAKKDVADAGDTMAVKASMGKSILWVVLGLAMLVLGSQIFVKGATLIAQMLGVSDAVIGLTIVAGGTSLPELATSVVSARKGQSALAIGNVIGSNVFNVLMILGLTATISPLATAGITWVDYVLFVVSLALLWGMSYTRYRVSRWEGWLLVALFVSYIVWLIWNV